MLAYNPLVFTQYGSDVEYRSSRRRGTDSSHRSRRPRSAVRFRDEVRVDTGHLHDLHRSVRDLSADHERLETELEREIRNRYRYVVSYSIFYCDFLNYFCVHLLVLIWLGGFVLIAKIMDVAVSSCNVVISSLQQ